ncbi:MAG: DUF5009 domain-containing protein [Muribaculaceae bacterium]|nr:DUF5009 domain-containing protein [Muribaculaceae bacterium]
MRAQSLDALRGFAIIMMVLSGTIAAGVLPNWMSHCQVPPATGFDPSIYGITWVDLVFPFFLFAMGAAFPFSIGSKLERGESKLKLSLSALGRCFRLVYFAVFIAHVYPWNMFGGLQNPLVWCLCIFSFILMFGMYLRFPWNIKPWLRFAIEFGSYAIGLIMMIWIDTRKAGTLSLNLYDNNIIILLLGIMAFFATVIYIFTRCSVLARLGVLPFIMAILLSKDCADSWQQWLFYYTPARWLFQFHFLKYLFIVLPGTVAGQFIKDWITEKNSINALSSANDSKIMKLLIPINVLLLLLSNLWGLYTRELVANFVISIALVASLFYCANVCGSNRKLFLNLARWGAYFLILGLFFEAYEGGIRKDDSTYSYYFVTSGLAFYCLIGFVMLCDVLKYDKIMSPLTMAGKNPMIAYVGTSIFIMPVLQLLHILPWMLENMTTRAIPGFLYGVILTSLDVLIAMYFTKIKWFWRT